MTSRAKLRAKRTGSHTAEAVSAKQSIPLSSLKRKFCFAFVHEFPTDAFSVAENEVEAEVLYAGGTVSMSGMKRGRAVAFSLSVKETALRQIQNDTEMHQAYLDHGRMEEAYLLADASSGNWGNGVCGNCNTHINLLTTTF